MCRAVTDWAPPLLASFANYGVRYHRPLYPGTLTCGGTVTAVADGVVELALWGRNGDGDIVATGTVTLKPAGSEVA
jgi:acyl dehydratase